MNLPIAMFLKTKEVFQFFVFLFLNIQPMGIPELKEKIKLQIENADERLLKIVSSVFDNNLDHSENLSDSEKKAIDEAIYQVQNHQTQSHDIVMEETKAKYSKYFKNEA